MDGGATVGGDGDEVDAGSEAADVKLQNVGVEVLLTHDFAAHSVDHLEAADGALGGDIDHLSGGVGVGDDFHTSLHITDTGGGIVASHEVATLGGVGNGAMHHVGTVVVDKGNEAALVGAEFGGQGVGIGLAVGAASSGFGSVCSLQQVLLKVELS